MKKCFFTGLTFLSTLTSVNSLSCVLVNNEEFKVRPQIVLIVKNLCFFVLVLKQVVVVIILMIHMQNGVFLILLKM